MQLTLLHMGELWDERFGGETSLYLTVCESKDMPIKGKLCYKPQPVIPSSLAPETHLTSTSGLLCLSTTWLSKFSRHMAAVREERTACRYGFNVAAYRGNKERKLRTALHRHTASPQNQHDSCVKG